MTEPGGYFGPMDDFMAAFRKSMIQTAIHGHHTFISCGARSGKTTYPSPPLNSLFQDAPQLPDLIPEVVSALVKRK